MTETQRLQKARRLTLEIIKLTSQYMNLVHGNKGGTPIAAQLGQLHAELLDAVTPNDESLVEAIAATLNPQHLDRN